MNCVEHTEIYERRKIMESHPFLFYEFSDNMKINLK